MGAMALMIGGQIHPQAAWDAINFGTIGTLFGLMLVSASFHEGGFYRWTAHKLGIMQVSPNILLGLMILVSAGLSALLTNDVVMVAMIPVLCAITIARQQNPIPYLLACCFASNIGSTMTLIGSPRNIILAETTHASFPEFSSITLLPSIISLFVIWGVLVLFYKNHWTLTPTADSSGTTLQESTANEAPAPFNRVETIKAVLVTVAVIAAFVWTDWPHVLIALSAGTLLLLNRKISSHNLLQNVDANLLLMLMGLFVVNKAISETGDLTVAMDWLQGIGINLNSALQAFPITAVISDIIGNSATMMLISPFIDPVREQAALLTASISMATGFSSNAVIFGSLSGIIAVEQAKANGVIITAREFGRSGIPITIITMLIAFAWVYF